MLIVSDFYLKKAINTQKILISYISIILGICLAFVPLLISLISNTNYNGTIKSSDEQLLFNVSIVTSSQFSIDINTIYIIAFISLLVLSIPIFILWLKYREYNIKYIRICISELIDEYINDNKTDSNALNTVNIETLYSHIKTSTSFPVKEILDAIYRKYMENSKSSRDDIIVIEDFLNRMGYMKNK